MTEKFVSDVEDQLRVADDHIEWMRCAGGRYVNVMYKCPHCESVDPENECHSPRPGFMRKAVIT